MNRQNKIKQLRRLFNELENNGWQDKEKAKNFLDLARTVPGIYQMEINKYLVSGVRVEFDQQGYRNSMNGKLLLIQEIPSEILGSCCTCYKEIMQSLEGQ